MTDVILRTGELIDSDVRLYPAGYDPGTGDSYTRAISDSALASDVLSRGFLAARHIADNAPATDVLDRNVIFVRLPVDLASASDDVLRSVVLTRLLEDYAPASDVVQAVQRGASIKGYITTHHELLAVITWEMGTCLA